MPEIFKNYIGGKWVGSVSGRTFTRNNPATGELVGTFTKSTPADVDSAVAAAKEAFKNWRLNPAPKRGDLLFKAAILLQERPKARRSERRAPPSRKSCGPCCRIPC